MDLLMIRLRVFGARWIAFAPVSWCWPLPATATEMTSAVAPSAAEPDTRVLHRQARACIRVYPLDRGVGVSMRPLGHEVVDVVGPVLDSGVPNLRAGQGDDLDHRGVERVGRCRWERYNPSI